MWLIMFGIVDLSAELDGIGFNYGGGETLSSKVISQRILIDRGSVDRHSDLWKRSRNRTDQFAKLRASIDLKQFPDVG